ncbi:MAG: hypothetical protein M1819_004391 [Sarea resinae]|nr:MAG: hypothetical protein M1819_004391 [Sarea resinae]
MSASTTTNATTTTTTATAATTILTSSSSSSPIAILAAPTTKSTFSNTTVLCPPFAESRQRQPRHLHSTCSINAHADPSILDPPVDRHSLDAGCTDSSSLYHDRLHHSFIDRHHQRLPSGITSNIDKLPLPYHFQPATSPPLFRSLTAIIDTVRDEMTTIAPAPGSPPELTGSKSSKSSSFHSSSQFSNHDGIVNDVSHFEDIGLEDDQTPPLQDIYGSFSTNYDRHSMPKRPSPRSPLVGSRNSTPAMGSMRDLTTTNKPGVSGLKNHMNGALSQKAALGPPNGGGGYRGFMSPSSPALAMGPGRRQRSRSPSPNLASSYSPSSGSLGNGASHMRQRPPRSGPPSRRGSWQKSRKTAEELEQELNDSDEDVPDDAVFWNVPISPRPLPERTISAAMSPSGSPPKSSPISNFAAGQESKSPAASAPIPISAMQRHGSMPSSPRQSGPSRGASTSSIPDQFMGPLSRTKSWTAALSDLSEEAQSLTAALEAHADEEGRLHEERVQTGAFVPRPSLAEKRGKAMVVELPPVRTSNVMIDPLPISKEKEKVLSRTRPSWLPPKSQKEEKKHLKEYQQMMTLSMEAEKKRAAKEKEAQHERDSTKSSLLRIWEEHVLSNWDRVIREPRTRELWWRGIAPRSRGIVWEKAVGNELELTAASYTAALKRAKDLEKKIQSGRNEGDAGTKEADWFASIRRDVQNTYPELKIFQPGGPLNEDFVDVLLAYSMYRSDVGYIYGTHLIAALLLLNLSPSSSFITLANLLNRPVPLAFLTNDPGAINRVYNLTSRALQYKFPSLSNHLSVDLRLPPETYLEPLFRSVFTRNISLDISTRIWDVYVFEGDSFLMRTAVGILGKLEGRLYGSREEVLAVLGWDNKETFDLGSEDEFLTWVRSAGKEERKGERAPSVSMR